MGVAGADRQIAAGAGSMRKMKDIYLVHLSNGLIGAYRPGLCPTITYAPQDKFIDFVDSLREDYSEYRLRCIDNQGTDRKTGKNRPDYFGKQ